MTDPFEQMCITYRAMMQMMAAHVRPDNFHEVSDTVWRWVRAVLSVEYELHGPKTSPSPSQPLTEPVKPVKVEATDLNGLRCACGKKKAVEYPMCYTCHLKERDND